MLEGAAGRNSSWPKELVAERRNKGLCGRLWARGAVREVARKRGYVREVAGEGVCAGVVCVVCVLHLLPFCIGTGCWGVLGCAGFFIFLYVRDSVLGFHVFFFYA